MRRARRCLAAWLWLILTPGLALVLLGTAAAQAPRVYRVGVIHYGGLYEAAVEGLREGLRELGFEEGKHYALLVRDTRGDLKAVEAAARQLEQQPVDLIYSISTSVTLAVKRGTSRVPVVFYAGTDPVAVGLVESFPKPGGRFTGVHGQLGDLSAKRFELLKEILPGLRRVVTFYNPENPAAQRSMKDGRDVAQQLKIELVERQVHTVRELRAALQALRPGEADAFFYVADAMVTSQMDAIIETARAKKLPAMFQEISAVTQGGLVAYGASYREAGRLSAKQVQRVLQGAPPSEQPVEQVSRPSLAINLKTAKALGLTIPRSLLLRADEVIQ